MKKSAHSLWQRLDGTGMAAVGLWMVCALVGSNAKAAQTITAVACAHADVLAAYAAALDGDIIVIPAGDCSQNGWTLMIDIKKGVTFQGAGAGKTVIGIAAPGGGFTIHHDDVVITGLTFECNFIANGENDPPILI